MTARATNRAVTTTGFPQVLILLMAFWYGSGSSAIDVRSRVEGCGVEGEARAAALASADRLEELLQEHHEQLVVFRERLGEALSGPGFSEERLRVVVRDAVAGAEATEERIVDERFTLRGFLAEGEWREVWREGAPR